MGQQQPTFVPVDNLTALTDDGRPWVALVER
jgi:hypothetical protein